MQLTIIAVGKKMPQWCSAASEEYLNRLPKEYCTKLIEVNMCKRVKTGSAATFMQKEAKEILKFIPEKSHLVVLDVCGELLSTELFADKLSKWQESVENLVFVIGGPDGLHNEIKQLAKYKLSFSKMTFPHPLARIILCEQIYRAYSVITNHPYHRS